MPPTPKTATYTPQLPPATPCTLAGIFTQSTLLYFRHFWPFTRPIILPFFYQVIGGYAAILGCYQLMHLFAPAIMAGNGASTTLLWLCVGVWTFLTIGLLCRGFVQYMIYFASLNLDAAEVLHGRQPDFKGAYRFVDTRMGPYGMFVLLILGIQAAWIATGLGGFILGAVFPPPLNLVVILIGLVISGILSLAAVIFTIYLSLGFQVVAFDTHLEKALDIAKHSIALTKGSFWRVVVILLGQFIVTSLIVPNLLTALIRAVHLTTPLDVFHQWFAAEVLEGFQPMLTNLTLDVPLFGSIQVYSYLQQHLADIAPSLTDTLLGIIITSLMLPWGTFGFTLLYGDCHSRLKKDA